MSIARLKDLQESFAVKHTFSVGDIVRWKDGMRNRPAVGPFVVVEVLDSQRIDGEKNSGRLSFYEQLDVLLGSLDADGDFDVYHYESRRLERVE